MPAASAEPAARIVIWSITTILCRIVAKMGNGTPNNLFSNIPSWHAAASGTWHSGGCALIFAAMMRVQLFLLGAAVATAVLAPITPVEAKKKEHHPAPPPTPAPAQPPSEGAQTLGTVSGWTAYLSKDKTGRICYVYGQPQKSEPA